MFSEEMGLSGLFIMGGYFGVLYVCDVIFFGHFLLFAWLTESVMGEQEQKAFQHGARKNYIII